MCTIYQTEILYLWKWTKRAVKIRMLKEKFVKNQDIKIFLILIEVQACKLWEKHKKYLFPVAIGT